MFVKIVIGAIGIVAALWAMGYDAATIKQTAHRWTNASGDTIDADSDDGWGADTY